MRTENLELQDIGHEVASNERRAPSVDHFRHAQQGGEEELAVFHVDRSCLICDCNLPCEMLFKADRSVLIGRRIWEFLPELREHDLLEGGEPNPCLRFLCRIGRHFSAVTHGGDHFASELFLNFLDNPGHHFASIIVRPALEGVGNRWAKPWLSRSGPLFRVRGPERHLGHSHGDITPQ